jgi:hypothetical protein
VRPLQSAARRCGRLPRSHDAERLDHSEASVLPLVVFLAFIIGLVVGSLVANATGHLPTAEELERQDRRRLSTPE